MKRLAIYSLVLLNFASCNTQRQAQIMDPPKLGDVVEAVQKQYLLALKQLADSGITGMIISKADLSLKVSRKTSGNADLTVAIFKPSTKFIQTRSSTVTYELSNKGGGTGGAFAIAKNNELRDMIFYALRNFAGLNNTIGDLTKSNVVLDIDFAVEKDLSGGFAFKVFGFSANVGAETDHTIDQDLKLTFSPKGLNP